VGLQTRGGLEPLQSSVVITPPPNRIALAPRPNFHLETLMSTSIRSRGPGPFATNWWQQRSSTCDPAC